MMNKTKARTIAEMPIEGMNLQGWYETAQMNFRASTYYRTKMVELQGRVAQLEDENRELRSERLVAKVREAWS